MNFFDDEDYNEDDFDFNGFLNESNKKFEADIEAMQQRMIVNAIETNYANIEENGISDWHLRFMDAKEIKALKNTLVQMIEHYVELEEYEKCALLQKNLDKVEGALEYRTASQDI
jgi:hypothetical protein